ncbi:MAG: hypothetical protein J6K92_08860 [Oscillospiraceae bacterium]|nr:hypothetical protein [Oscillospiraceae bacterium]
MKFEYKRPNDLKLEAYGKTYEIPPKTAYLVDEIDKINVRIGVEGSTAADQIKAVRDGIALFIGEEEAERIFPRETLVTDLNTDEITAFWFCLNECSNRETEAVMKRYAPKPKEEIKVTTNPKK